MKTPPKPRKLLSPATFAERFDCSRQLVYKLMNTGVIKFVHIGADRRIPESEADRIAIEGTRGQTGKSDAAAA